MSTSDEMKKVLLAGIGCVAVTAEKSFSLLERLIEKGEVTVEQGKVLNEELKRNMKKAVKETEQIKKDKKDIIDELQKMTPTELAILKEKIAEMEKVGDGKECENGES